MARNESNLGDDLRSLARDLGPEQAFTARLLQQAAEQADVMRRALIEQDRDHAEELGKVRAVLAERDRDFDRADAALRKVDSVRRYIRQAQAVHVEVSSGEIERRLDGIIGTMFADGA